MGDTTPSQPGGVPRPVRQYLPSKPWPSGGPGAQHLPADHARPQDRPRTNPVTVVEHDGRRWLVAPYGPVSWVHNARAATAPAALLP